MDLGRDAFTVTYDPGRVDVEAIMLRIRGLGFKPETVSDAAPVPRVALSERDAVPEPVGDALARARTANRLTLIDFYAAWCGPCQVMGPVIKELAEEFQTRAVVAKVNVDDHQEIAARYGIQSIPTLMIFQNGEVVDQMVGTMSKTALAQKLESQRQPA